MASIIDKFKGKEGELVVKTRGGRKLEPNTVRITASTANLSALNLPKEVIAVTVERFSDPDGLRLAFYANYPSAGWSVSRIKNKNPGKSSVTVAIVLSTRLKKVLGKPGTFRAEQGPRGRGRPRPGDPVATWFVDLSAPA